MGIGITILIVVVALFVVFGFFSWLFAVYNGLIQVKNNIKKAWANIDVLLKQRHDELPKLIQSVKGYMKHEKGTLEEITKARTAVMSAKGPAAKGQANNMLEGALKSLFAVAENYPDLKANENFMHLQTRISGLENEIADRREFYNDSVNSFNIRIQSIPDVIIANMLGYKEEEMFTVSATDREDVDVKF